MEKTKVRITINTELETILYNGSIHHFKDIGIAELKDRTKIQEAILPHIVNDWDEDVEYIFSFFPIDMKK